MKEVEPKKDPYIMGRDAAYNGLRSGKGSAKLNELFAELSADLDDGDLDDFYDGWHDGAERAWEGDEE